MNILFLANNPQVYLEFAIRLEQNNIPFWVADNVNDFHHMISRMRVDIVFADYNFLNFKKFNVYNHLKRNNSEILFIFINEPEGAENLFVNWEDQVNDKYPNRWTKELEDLLRIVANQPMIEYLSYEPAKVTDLLSKIEKNAGATTNNEWEGLIVKNKDYGKEYNILSDENNFQKKENKSKEENKSMEESPREQVESILPHQDIITNTTGLQDRSSFFYEKSLLENFLYVKQNCNLSYVEYMLLSMFKKKKNEIINTMDIAKLLNLPHNEKGKNKIYQYIHKIRLFIQEEESDISLIRVAKGCYSLICPSQSY